MSPLFFSRHSSVLSVSFLIVATSDGSNFRAWGLETTLFSPIQFRGPLSQLFRSGFHSIFLLVQSSEKHVYELHFSPSTLLLPILCLDSFLPQSCTQFSKLSSFSSALLLLWSQEFIFHNVQHQSQVSLLRSLSWLSMSLTVGKPFSSPLAACLPHSCFHCNSSSTVIIILKSHSGSEGRLCLSEDAHRHTHSAEISLDEKIAADTHREEHKERRERSSGGEGQSAAVLMMPVCKLTTRWSPETPSKLHMSPWTGTLFR